MATTSSTTSTSGGPADESVHGGRASSTRSAALDAERRLVGFALDLVEAPEGAGGALRSDGDDAALRVVLAARGVRPVVVPTDGAARAQVGPMAHAMDEQAVLAVVSAPSPALGVVDPVTWIGTAATAKQVPLHVDARAGGWLLACAERLGRIGPAWSFAAPGVASLTLDLPLRHGSATLLLLRCACRRPAGRAGTARSPDG